MSDPLDEFLEHPPTRPDPAELRRHLLRQTTAVVRRRRQNRRMMAAAALAAAVVLAVVAGWLSWFRDAPIQEEPRVVQPQPAPRSPAASDTEAPALALEWRAFDAPPTKQAELYQQAGDRYEEERDLASAVRCYGQAVQAAPSIEIDANDNWLVMALKLDEIERRRER
jgi:hypothetical protein